MLSGISIDDPHMLMWFVCEFSYASSGYDPALGHGLSLSSVR